MIPAKPDEREDSFIEQLAAADEALAVGETPRFSDSDPDLRDRLERGLACMQLLRECRSSPKSDTAPLGHPPGSLGRIGRFQIKRELGRGGFGVVLLAYDPHLNREVALKVPRADAFVTPDLRERFQREARAAASLDHPSIVPVYEAGEVGPVCYIASAYCPGITMADWLRQRKEPVPFADAATLVAHLSDAVDHAHGRGILHRDLKPANILLQESGVKSQASVVRSMESELSGPMTEVRTGSSGSSSLTTDLCPKITDFGLAKLLDGTAAASDDPTRTGAILGTPSYMAPEQAEGNGPALSPPTDVYALGAILYELLTGRPPFRGESELDTLMHVRTNEPVAPSRLRPKTPRDLETICLKCLRKEPARRYATAGELAADLGRWLRNEPIRARPVRAVEKAVKWAKRRPMVAALAGAIVLLTVTAFVVVTILWRQADEARSAAEAQLAEKLTALAHRHWIAIEMTEAKHYLEQVPPEHRGREWRYLHRACHAELHVVRDGKKTLAGPSLLAYSPDGSRLASLRGVTIQVLDAATARELLAVNVPGEQLMTGLSFSGDGQKILVGIMDTGPSRIQAGRHAGIAAFDVADGRRTDILGFSQEFGTTAFLSGDARRCASDDGRTCSIWDVTTGNRLFTLPVPSATGYLHTLDSEGTRLAVKRANIALEVWDIANGRLWCALPREMSVAHAVAFNPSSADLAAATRAERHEQGQLHVWDLAASPKIRFQRQFDSLPICLKYSPDSRRIAIGFADNAILICDARTGDDLITLRGHGGPVFSIAFSPDGRRLASSAKDGTARIWDVTAVKSE